MKDFLSGPVGIFYAFIFVYIAIVPVDSDLLVRSFALIFVFFVFVFVMLGYLGAATSDRYLACVRLSLFSKKLKFLFLVSQFLLAFYVGNFYTGLSVGEAIKNVYLGDSNYSAYQYYFAESGLSEFAFSKIPAVFSYFMVKMIFVFFVFNLVVSGSKRVPVFWLAGYALPVLVVGFFRGTNIELFEVFIVFLCAFHVKSLFVVGYSFPFFKVSFYSFVLILLYSLQINLRYSFEFAPSCLNEYCYSEGAFLYRLLPALSALSDYFYFAPDYMARLFGYFVEQGSFFSLFLPANGELFGYRAKWLCVEFIACGPTWSPDLERLVYIVGLFGAVAVMFLLGYVYRRLIRSAGNSFLGFLGFYLVALQLISLPVGNFLFVSSSNQLMLFFYFGWLILHFFSKYRLKVG